MATKPGPPITFFIPFRMPFAISLPAPSPSITLLISDKTDFKGSKIALAIGSKVCLPIFSCSLLNSVAV